jgi:pimeloyl-ACP methyl ester carboxylesterase
MTTEAPKPDESFTVEMTDGVKIEIRRYGVGKGPCLVITHGNGFAIDGYRVFWEPLLEHFELALFDMRNHGRNAPSGGDGHHYKQLSIDIGTVHQAIKPRLAPKQPIVGVFHSFSARSAMKHAVEIGWVWDAMFLYDPPNVPPRGHALYEAMRAFEVRLVEFACNRPDRFDSADGMVKTYRESRATARWVPQAIEEMGRAVVRRNDDEAGWSLTCQRELESSIYLAALTLDLWPKASDYGGPVKLIGADPDLKGNVPTGLANQALAREGGYAYEFIPQTGHLLQVERPEECRNAMLSYLRELGIA